jgi:hypothetical protein
VRLARANSSWLAAPRAKPLSTRTCQRTAINTATTPPYPNTRTTHTHTHTGTVVALQWPNPRVFCYKTSYSDMPSNSLRSCCSLYSLNLGFTVFWMLVFAIMVIARDIVRIIICLCFCLVHVMVVVIFR